MLLEKCIQTITEIYVRYRARFGTTLVFATRVLQARLLTARLRASGLAADYVTCSRPESDNRHVFKRFCGCEDGLEVVVNVELLINRADYPAI